MNSFCFKWEQSLRKYRRLNNGSLKNTVTSKSRREDQDMAIKRKGPMLTPRNGAPSPNRHLVLETYTSLHLSLVCYPKEAS